MENQIYKHAMHGNTKFTGEYAVYTWRTRYINMPCMAIQSLWGECAVYTWRTRYIYMPCMAIQSLRVNVQCIHGEPDIYTCHAWQYKVYG